MPKKEVGLSSKELNKFVKASYKKKKDANEVNGYSLDKELSTKRSKVYVSPKGKTVVAHSGTDSASDWVHNLAVPIPSLYKKQDRYKRAEAVQKEANRKYGKDNITTVSHSQSGQIANIMSKKGLTNKSVSLNPAIIGKHDPKLKVVRSAYDPVSALTSMDKNDLTIEGDTINPLVEHNPAILSRVNIGLGKYIKPHLSHNYMHIEF